MTTCRIDGGQCVNKHGATRCLATLRLCFSRTRLCQWCGTHYRREPGNYQHKFVIANKKTDAF